MTRRWIPYDPADPVWFVVKTAPRYGWQRLTGTGPDLVMVAPCQGGWEGAAHIGTGETFDGTGWVPDVGGYAVYYEEDCAKAAVRVAWTVQRAYLDWVKAGGGAS